MSRQKNPAILKGFCYYSPKYPITTPKLAHIYPHTFSTENFSPKKFGPLGPPWGIWGPYLGIPSVEYFPNVFF